MSALVEYVGAFTETVLEHFPDADVAWSGDSTDRTVIVTFDSGWQELAWKHSESVEDICNHPIPIGMAVLEATAFNARIQADIRRCGK